MVQLRHRMRGALLVASLLGCAANSRLSSDAGESEPDCSFRSPTTCWPAGGRFPARIPPKPAQPERITRDSATVLAVLADSVREMGKR